jgi:hypothetical protein
MTVTMTATTAVAMTADTIATMTVTVTSPLPSPVEIIADLPRRRSPPAWSDYDRLEDWLGRVLNGEHLAGSAE